MLVNALPETNAPKDKNTLASMFRTAKWRQRLSNKLQASSANDYMLVNEPQKHMDMNSV